MEKNQQLISILIPCFNSVGTIDRCLKSILDQDYQNLEIIGGDDFSNDGSYEKIVELKNKNNIENLKIFRNKGNQGISVARGNLLHEYSGEAFLFVDSDDYLSCSNAISIFYKASNGLTYDVVIGKHLMKYPENDTTTPLLKWGGNRGNKTSFSFSDSSKKANAFFWGNTLFSRDFQKKHSELLPQNVSGSTMDEEGFLLVLFSMAKTFKYINKVTYYYCYSKFSSSFHKNLSEEKFNNSIDNLRRSIFLFKKYKNEISIDNQRCFYCGLYFLNDIFYYRLRSSKQISRKTSKKLFKEHKVAIKSCFSKRLFFYKGGKFVVYFCMMFRKIFGI